MSNLVLFFSFFFRAQSCNVFCFHVRVVSFAINCKLDEEFSIYLSLSLLSRIRGVKPSGKKLNLLSAKAIISPLGETMCGNRENRREGASKETRLRSRATIKEVGAVRARGENIPFHVGVDR